jgi:hypothetical protein
MSIFSRFFAPDFTEHTDKSTWSISSLKDGLYKKLFLDTDRINAIKGISRELDEDLMRLREHVLNFNQKMELVNEFLQSKSTNDLNRIKDEVKRIKKILRSEYDEDKREDTYVIKILRTLQNLMDTETNGTIADEESQIKSYIIELKDDIEKLEPCLVRQLTFFELSPSEQNAGIKNLLFDIREEAAIIGYEENLISQLKKEIDKFEIEAIFEDKEK